MTRIITIDGPSGSGKGTVAGLLAQRLGWRILDSGALYRLVGEAAREAGIDFNNEEEVADIARKLDANFEGDKIFLGERDVTNVIRSETAGNNASKVAAIPRVREALLQWQRGYACEPGLVADGRDMGTVVFPEAQLKIFLDASPEERAKRRYKQLIEKGLPANLASLTAEIRERDERDRSRSVAPLRPAEDAIVIDSTNLGIDEVLTEIMGHVHRVFPDLET